MEGLKKQRGLTKGKITRIQTFLQVFDPSTGKIKELSVRLEGLESAWAEYNEIVHKIIGSDDESEATAQETELEEMEGKYYTIKSKIETLIEDLARPPASVSSQASATHIAHGSVSSGSSSDPADLQGLPTLPLAPHPSATTSTSMDVKLPRLDLPKFSGDYMTWTSFHDLFTSIIHKNTKISNVQKLHYLKSSVSGEAEGLLQSVDITDANYELAWNLLKDRYQKERQIIQSHLSKLLTLPPVVADSAANLRKLLDSTMKHVRAIQVLGVATDQWDAILVFILSDRLDTDTRREWELEIGREKNPRFDRICTFVEERCRALEASSACNQKRKYPGESKAESYQPLKVTRTHYSSSSSCLMPSCKLSHPLYQCKDFMSLEVFERFNLVKRNNCCFNCLREGHSVSQCPSSSTCRKSGCNGKHHTLLHHGKAAPDHQSQFSSAQVTHPPPAQSSDSTSKHVFHSQQHNTEILLATAVIKVKDAFGNLVPMRALLDNGSQMSFITEAGVQRLGLKRLHARNNLFALGKRTVGSRGNLEIEFLSSTSSYTQKLQVMVLPEVTGELPNTFFNTSKWSHLKDLELADPGFNKPGPVDILLDADVYSRVLIQEKISHLSGVPYAQNTRLGWILSGKVNHNYHSLARSHISTLEVQDQLKQFWELDQLPEQQHFTPEEKACESHFQTHVRRDSTGRYIVSLPLQDDPSLGYSKQIALKRLEYVEKRLNRNPEHKDEYHKFMKQYLELGHMEPIPIAERNEAIPRTCYLPHHFVLKESSTTTKLRVVFDGSCKTSNGNSLNNNLMVGPKIQPDIFDMLLNFRLHIHAFTADISKMYRQFRVTPTDADMQRILWRTSPLDPVGEFRLTTVTYGTASAPFLATRALQQLALDEGDKYPLAKEVVLRNFYVDDVMSGASSINELLELKSQLLQITASAGLELVKWCSNSSALLESLPVEYRETQLPLAIDSSDSVKALGLLWNPGPDYFFFRVALPSRSTEPNKRHILSDISRLYDPLGWLAPVILIGKLLFQKLWSLGITWDDPLPGSIVQDWLQFRMQLKELEQLRITRPIMTDVNSSHQLHGFCDASQSAFSACVYLRSEDSQGCVSTYLLCSKTRVAPVKTVSIARLELCGALLVAQLITKVKNTLNLPLQSVHAWTDSTITLDWLSDHPSRWVTFVANRVSLIQDLVPPSNWRHVPTLENPADCASKGILPMELTNHHLWWTGAPWLSLTSQSWPPPYRGGSNDLDGSERKAPVTLKAFVNVKPSAPIDLFQKFSSLCKLQRVSAYCFRFCRNLKAPKNERETGPLTVGELSNSLLFWVKEAQQLEFSDELEKLKKGKPSSISALNPFIDENGMLRVGGRLRFSKLNYDRKHPILLPKTHKITQFIIEYEHLKHFHAGPQLLLSILNQKFWIVNGRTLVRHLIHKCVRCCRARPVLQQQLMGDLPAVRLEPSRAFLRTSVDFAGPITLKNWKGRGAKTFKAYIALFCCLATKAVHLELVSDLTTDAFIAALKRMVARRGICSDIYSDNGTNFQGAEKELDDLLKLYRSEAHNKLVSDHLAKEEIKWHFAPPRGPHFGGLWEAGVKSVKKHLRATVGNNTLTFEEMYTVLTQIEACLNSRPLTPLTADPSDLQILTPGHFIIQDSLLAIPEPDLTHLQMNRLSRWQLIQQLSQHFWKRWQLEYLTTLQRRSKWSSPRKNVEIGDMVLIKEDNIPALKWLMGRIIDTHPGKDNYVRVVSVKTETGIYKRPVAKICILPIKT